MEMDLKTKIEVLPCSKCEDMIDCESCYLQKEAQELYEQIRADAIDEVANEIINLPTKYIDNFDYVSVALILNKLEQLKEQNHE